MTISKKMSAAPGRYSKLPTSADKLPSNGPRQSTPE